MGQIALPEIREVTSDHGDARAMIDLHAAYCAAHTPENSGHAVQSAALPSLGLRYWIACDGAEPVGSIGLRLLEKGHGEIKTMHVVKGWRGRGLADLLLQQLLGAAQHEGLHRISLETGKGPGFEASRRFYARHGFSPCPAYGAYADDPFSYCMTRVLAVPGAPD